MLLIKFRPSNQAVTTTADIHALQERELLDRIASGDEAAFTEVFYYYGKRVWWFIFKKIKSESIADEVVQEVFLKLWVRRELLGEIEDLRAYIYTMAVNNAYDQLKKIAGDQKRLEKLRHHMKDADTGNPVEELVDYRESQDIVNQAIGLLPPQRKKIYLLNRMEGLSYEEIAERLQISKSTVSNHLVEATKFIREFVKGNGGVAIIAMILETKFCR